MPSSPTQRQVKLLTAELDSLAETLAMTAGKWPDRPLFFAPRAAVEEARAILADAALLVVTEQKAGV